jgi:gliding motility-associated-like protein
MRIKISAPLLLLFFAIIIGTYGAKAQPFGFTYVNSAPCAATTAFTITGITTPVDSTLWNFGHPASGVNDTSTQASPSHAYGAFGPYTVNLYVLVGTTWDTITQSITVAAVNPVNWSPIMSYCTDTLVLDVTTPGATAYSWSNGSTGPTATITNNGLVYVNITTPCGVFGDTAVFQLFPQLQADLGPDFIICQGDVISLTPTLNFNNGVSYLWSNGATTSSISISAAGTYWVTVEDSCYIDTDSVTVTIPAPFTFNFGPDQVLCSGESVVLNPNITAPNIQYTWYSIPSSMPISTQSTYTVNTGGTYWLSATNDCEIIRDTIVIWSPPALNFSLGPNQTICNGDTVILDPNLPAPVVGGRSYLWQDGSTDSIFTATQSGTYTLTVTDSCTTHTASMTITIPSGIIVDLGNDTTYCVGDVMILDPGLPIDWSYLWQDGSTLPYYTATSVGTYWVEVASDCDISSDTVVLNPYQGFTVDLGNDTIICPEDMYYITLDYPNSTYVWPDGSTGNSYLVPAPGNYQVYVLNICDTILSTVKRVDYEPCDCELYVPNAFTPNEDGKNDMFRPRTACLIMEYDFRIFTRYGKEVFATDQIIDGWDGKVGDEYLQDDLYMYRIIYTGLSKRGRVYQKELRGTIAIIK